MTVWTRSGLTDRSIIGQIPFVGVSLFARLREQSHVLTGCSIGEFHQRLLEIRAYDSIPDLDVIRGWINLYFERHGKFPSQNSERLSEMRVGWKAGWPGESWAGMKACLRNGSRGLPAGEWTLATLAEEHCGHVIEKKRPRLSKAIIVAHIRLHLKKHGRFPTVNSGEVESFPGEHWRNWDRAGFTGTRGLIRGDSLAKIKREIFGPGPGNKADGVVVASLAGEPGRRPISINRSRR